MKGRRRSEILAARRQEARQRKFSKVAAANTERRLRYKEAAKRNALARPKRRRNRRRRRGQNNFTPPITIYEDKLARLFDKEGIQYERQHTFEFRSGNPYYADFYLPKSYVIVEVDGASHDGREDYDRRRSQRIYGLSQIKKILRIRNEEVVPSHPKLLKLIDRIRELEMEALVDSALV